MTKASTPSNDAHHVRWPAERFYWAVIDASALPKGALSRAGRRQRLDYMFESMVPVTIDQVHAIYARVNRRSDRWLACGIDRAALDHDELANAITLTPQSLPPFVEAEPGASKFNPNRLNLLTGPHLPAAVKRTNRRWLMQIATIALLIPLLMTWGLERRRQIALEEAGAFHAAKAALLSDMLDDTSTATPQPAPPAPAPELRLTAELRRLRQTRDVTLPPELAAGSAAESLAMLLQRIPTSGGVFALVQSISITESSMILRADVPTTVDAERFIAVYQEGDLRGWSLLSPSVSAGRDAVSVTMQFKRESSS